jgi:hypothetical protein
MTEPSLNPSGVGGIGSKLRDHHLRRQAIVYVRQSHPQQVVENVESTARQYALVERAIAWGWSPERVIVIDEDQGQSGQSIATRLGFQRLLAEVSLDHVGLILGLELSRLPARTKTGINYSNSVRFLAPCWPMPMVCMIQRIIIDIIGFNQS